MRRFLCLPTPSGRPRAPWGGSGCADVPPCVYASFVKSDQQHLEDLLRAQHACISMCTLEEHYAAEIIQAAALGRTLWFWSAMRGMWPGELEGSLPVPNTENPAAALYYLTREIRDTLRERPICVMFDLVGHLSDERTLRALREAIDAFRKAEGCVILVDHQENLPAIIAAESTRLELSLPGLEELERIVRNTLARLAMDQPVEAKLSRRELQTMLRNLSGLTRRQAEQIIVDSVIDDRQLDLADINAILAHKRRRMQHDGVLEYVEAPVDLDEVGGLSALKQWLAHRRDAFSEEAAAFGLCAPRGILMLGVQGAGKSMASKAIATAWQRPLLRLDPGALYDRYVGESERRLREALHQAEMMAPIILWIDEIEKGFASAASHSTDGGLSQRMFGTLLTWMQEHRAPVFLVATANDIQALPPELLRKGRFDEIFFVDLPSRTVRRQIFAIHLARRNRDPEKFDLEALAAASEGYSGAEIEQCVLGALHEAFASKREIDTAALVEAIRRSPPLSVTMAERIDALRDWSQGRCVPAE